MKTNIDYVEVVKDDNGDVDIVVIYFKDGTREISSNIKYR